MRTMLLGFAVGVIAVGCAGNPVEPSDVSGREWRLMSIQRFGNNPVVVENPSRYTLRLDEDGRAAVRSDCNTCGSSYTLNGSSLKRDPLACTRVFCGDASLDSQYRAGARRHEKNELKSFSRALDNISIVS